MGILQQLCFVRLFFWPDCEPWTVSLTNCDFFCSVHMRLMHNMFCCGKLCTLVLSLWDFTLYSCKGDDINIQRRHTKLGNNELKRQFATTEVNGWYRSHRAVQRRVSPKRGTYTKWSGKNSLKWWLVWGIDLRTQAPLPFWLLPVWNDKMGNGKSKENLEKICGMQFFFLVFLSFWTVRTYFLNWSNSRKYVLGEEWLCSSRKDGSGFGQ